MNILFRDIVGTIIILVIIIVGIIMLYDGNLITGLTWSIGGLSLLGIAIFDIWSRYK